MKDYFTLNEWSVIEESFRPELNKISESVFSLGNGRMGHRASFEEKYSGETLPGHYLAGIYYLEKSKINGGQKGYPEYYTKSLNAPNWIGINVNIDGYELDITTCQVLAFRRELNMREGYLYRRAQLRLPDGKEVEINSLRFTSLADDELGAIRYAVTPLNFSSAITFTPYLDAEIVNANAPDDEELWHEVNRTCTAGEAYITTETQNTVFQVCTGMRLMLEKDGTGVETTVETLERDKFVGNKITAIVAAGEEFVLYKYAAVISSENYPAEKLNIACELALDRATSIGFARLLDAHGEVWAERWQESDVVIKGDLAAQQGIRFSIFQLHQAYSGEYENLSISSYGFTGVKYSATFWDTEIYCFPFYLATAPPHVAQNLLRYRYNQLPQAIQNAEKLGFSQGAALYPMATINGEECYSEAELTLETIHRNGAMAYAIYDYCQYTADVDYLAQYGLEVLVGISRFWAQRVNWSEARQQYELLGVDGPNQNDKNVNQNWFTSSLASWNLQFTMEALHRVKESLPEQYAALCQILHLDNVAETAKWQDIINNLYFPIDEKQGGFLQQEDYLDKEQILVKDLGPDQRPVTQKWSRDRILRSGFIQQADVLLGIYLFEDKYDLETIRRNFHFYEPRTLRESALSPVVPAILAAKIGEVDLAYEYYQRTARHDLDNLNHDTAEGCHISSMGGAWLALVKGFGGMRVISGSLYFQPILPRHWEKYAFKIRFREHLLTITVTQTQVKIFNESDNSLGLQVYGIAENIPPNTLLSRER